MAPDPPAASPAWPLKIVAANCFRSGIGGEQANLSTIRRAALKGFLRTNRHRFTLA
jgi:hypothetical protein